MVRIPIVSFAAGVLALQTLPSLPGQGLLAQALILALIALLLAFFVFPKPQCLRLAAILLLAFVCGFSWAALRAEWRLADALPMQDEARNVTVVGVIDGLPQRFDDGGWRFVLKVETSDASVPGSIQLGWYLPWGREEALLPLQLRPGERWQLVVRLKRPHGFANPGGFDYERWLLERGIRATGYVRHEGDNRRLDAFVPSFMNFVHAQRERVRQRFVEVLGDRPHAGVMVALAIGDQRAIPLVNRNK